MTRKKPGSIATTRTTYTNDGAIKTLRVPEYWAMFTPPGDAAMTEAARSLVSCVAMPGKNVKERTACFKTYVENYDIVVSTPGMKEAADTAVFEIVEDFATDLAVEVTVDPRLVSGILRNKDGPVRAWNCTNPRIKERKWWDCNPSPGK